MRTVLLPVKDFKTAKQRLAPALTSRQRAELAQAMLSDVLTAIAQARRPERVVVYTGSEDVAEVVRPFDFDIVQETHVYGHSVAVNKMVQELSRFATHILAIAGDLPLLKPEEVDSVFDRTATELSLVSSRDGTGTNAALFVMPARITMEYGDGSLRRHLANAEQARIRPAVLSIPGIEFDVDTPEDLHSYTRLGPNPSNTWRFVSTL